MPPANAFTSCEACRRLKRRCSRDTPSCRLCTRLGKTCNYVTEHAISSHRASTNDLVRQGYADPATELDLHQTNNFPCSYFLDSDFFQPISRDILTIHDGPFFLEQQRRFAIAGIFDSLIEHYANTIHHWLPILSIKRLKQTAKSLEDPTRGVVDVLVFVALEALVSHGDRPTSLPQSNPSYLKAKHGSFIAESGGTINIRLIQTIVLVALYEFGHSIYPAAYLTIGQAVRLATMVGLHSKKDAKQLFVEPETWTLCEEQRRTWWAIVMLDRVVVAGSPRLLMAAPDPNTNDVLPCNDDDWTNGRIGFNEALFTRNFHSPSSVGHFARVCQAVHMFGKILHHIKAREKDTDPVELTAEALQLHIVLTALDQGIMSSDCDIATAHGSLHSALSLCSLARLLLYNEYACNEPSFITARERLAAEVEMQQISLEGIQDIVSKTIPRMARQIVSASQQQSKGPRHSPILAGCLYHAATECAWFVKENNDTEMVAGLDAITRALQALKSEWSVCSKLLHFGPNICKMADQYYADKYLSYLEGNKMQD
ncbi:related to Zn(II)Cys6 transcriptional activator [Fusarium fujikuroi]|nr:related to Zn(II)Cys6 transcriptional activator [Fusarium fujikuroi]